MFGNFRLGNRFYPMLAFVAWFLCGLATLRYPNSGFATEFHGLTVLLAMALQNGFARQQDYYTRTRDNKQGEIKEP